MNRTFHFEEEQKTDRHNIAYLISKTESHDFASTSYRLLPEIVEISYFMPVKMSRYPPYDRLFEIAFMRAVQAGALEAKLQNDQERQSKSRQTQQEDQRKPISLHSFLPVFVVWSIGGGIAFSVFLLECCSTRIFLNETAA